MRKLFIPLLLPRYSSTRRIWASTFCIFFFTPLLFNFYFLKSRQRVKKPLTSDWIMMVAPIYIRRNFAVHLPRYPFMTRCKMSAFVFCLPSMRICTTCFFARNMRSYFCTVSAYLSRITFNVIDVRRSLFRTTFRHKVRSLSRECFCNIFLYWVCTFSILKMAWIVITALKYLSLSRPTLILCILNKCESFEAPCNITRILPTFFYTSLLFIILCSSIACFVLALNRRL